MATYAMPRKIHWGRSRSGTTMRRKPAMIAPTDGRGEPLAHRRLVGQMLERLGDLRPADEPTIGGEEEHADPEDDVVAPLEGGQRPHAYTLGGCRSERQRRHSARRRPSSA